MSELWDDPNRQAVGLAPAGSGGEPEPQADPLYAMTKDELIEEASSRGVDVADSMTKAEIKAALEAS